MMKKDNKIITPLISIVIPAFNAERYIAQTLNSVLNQDYPSFEVIVVNDGSTDQTLTILKQYEDKITLIDIKNHGVSFARNLAVKNAKGAWLAFIDADDLWDNNKLSIQFNALDGELWSHCNSLYIGDDQPGNVTRADLSSQDSGMIFSSLLLENFITTSTVLIKKSLFTASQGFDENFDALEDWKLWLEISKNHPIAYIAEPIAEYRVYQGSTSRKARKMLPLHLKVIDSAFEEKLTEITYRNLRRSAYFKSYNICSYIAEDSHDYRFSFKCALKGLAIKPWSYAQIKRIVRCSINILTA